MVPRQLPKYTDEFRDDAIDLLMRTKRSLPEVARDLGVSVGSLRSWYNARVAKKKAKGAPTKKSPPPKGAEATESAEETIRRQQREIESLRRKVEDLEEDRELLKKAATFFAKESE